MRRNILQQKSTRKILGKRQQLKLHKVIQNAYVVERMHF